MRWILGVLGGGVVIQLIGGAVVGVVQFILDDGAVFLDDNLERCYSQLNLTPALAKPVRDVVPA